MRASWEQFSTERIHASEKVRRWTEFGRRTFGHDLVVVPNGTDAFEASLTRITVGSLVLANVKSTSATAMGDAGGISRSTAAQDALMISMPQRGSYHYRCGADEATLAPGDLYLRDLSTPWELACPHDMDLITVKIPYADLLDEVDDPHRLVGLKFCGRVPLVTMASGMIRSIHQMLLTETSAPCRQVLSDIILDCVRVLHVAAAEGTRCAVDAADRTALRRRAMNLILRNLDDPELTVAGVASQLGVGCRSLQRAFFATGQSPQQFLVNQRLDRAARLLTLRESSRFRPIIDIALSVGFSDASHFSRSFAHRYRVAPSRYRGSPPVA